MRDERGTIVLIKDALGRLNELVAEDCHIIMAPFQDAAIKCNIYKIDKLKAKYK